MTDHPKSDRSDRRACGRLMVGSGSDTHDPLCGLPEGHAGSCRSTAAVDQHRISVEQMDAAWDKGYTRPVPTTVEVTALEIGPKDYRWRIVSDCGVVKVYSTRDGCMMAVAPEQARRIAEEFADAMNEAADCTDVRSYGEVISR